MYFKTSILLLCCIILFSFCQLHSQAISTNNLTSLFEQFADQTGFKGDVTLADDGRIFSKLKGTFNLPVPGDSIALQFNKPIK